MELQATPHDAVPRFQVLGPVQAWRDEQPLALGSPQQQAVLTTLLLHHGRPVTTQELVDGLWGDRPPPQAVAALRTYISRLRSVVEPGREVRKPAELLISVRDGYALRIPDESLDLAIFNARTAEAAGARQAGQPEAAHHLLTSALSLWNGQPLAGIPGPYAESQRQLLVDHQVAAREERCTVALEIGLHAEIVGELSNLTAEHPLREGLRELLMLALYRCGRQAEALNVYAATRKLLIEELGVEPGAALAAMHSRILSADPSLMNSAPELRIPAAESVALAPPAQLPADVSDFSGREKLVGELRELLRRASGQAVVVTSLAGIGGVGKTTLAVHVAHGVRSEFPDGQLYVDLRGVSATPADPAVVLGDFLFALGVTEAPESFEQRVAMYRSMLADRRMLIMLDNAHDAEQITPLIPGVAGCAVLATSRSRLAGIPGGHLFDVEELRPDEALELFGAIAGRHRVEAEPDAALAVVTSCGFLPLAVRIAAARLASRPRWTVADLARRLADQRRRLDELQLGNLAVETTLGLGYGQLRAEEARAFRLLALVDCPDLPLSAVAALLGTGEDEAEDLAEALVEANMLECFTPGRYRYHDLLRLFAQKQREKEADLADTQAALLRLLALLVATVRNAAQILEPDEQLSEPLQVVTHPGEQLNGADSARGWLRSELALILGAIDESINGPAEQLRLSIDLLVTLNTVAEEANHAQRIRRALAVAETASAEHGDTDALARVRYTLAFFAYLTGSYPEAERALRDCLAVLGTQTPRLRSAASSLLGTVLTTASHPAEALPFLEEARDLSTTLAAMGSAARIEGNIARVHLKLEQWDAAVESAGSAVATARASGNVRCLADTLYQLGVVLRTTGSPAEAATQLREAHQLYQDQQQRLWEGLSLARLAGSLLADDQLTEAAQAAEEALTIAQEMDTAYCQGLANAALGEALLRLGTPVRGLACLAEAQEIFTRLGVPEAHAVRSLIDEQHTEPSSTTSAP
ncbi:DNA-binding SARP family transcriptional activator/tetratricopeptide (TPR) repeat protein [Kitasatospora sp. GAS204A]|uniref:AfsR/SARP family transcriptional regulator n=1 Tax=unclassified Kitasatospora TaxID=2633591 RepID=UPI0024737CA5|nr:AfsR/SARP family transcriptional regulator [Kitasatospora sp. GAS204B]MDH6116588.1 DNA-binding SARP family transcriptional activator/tetratricopeptide (TPR) repeat protein [Kitasatospora sp. GAS204B]